MSVIVQVYCLSIKKYITYYIHHGKAASQHDHPFFKFNANLADIYCLKHLFLPKQYIYV